MTAGILSLKRAIRWIRSNSLWYVTTGAGCCADEVLMAMGCRYDLERFGCVHEVDAGKADLLIVNGIVTRKSAPALRVFYDRMVAPKYVMALGACACTGGPFAPDLSYATVGGVEKVIPVDVFVPGCPPRPEAIMNGLINLQEKIRGSGIAEIVH